MAKTNSYLVFLFLGIFFSSACSCFAQSSNAQKPITKGKVVDRIIWLVGDEPILFSDVEYQKMRLQSENANIHGDLNCIIPEQMAVQMLFLAQAEIDSLTVDESMINRQVDGYLKNLVTQVGSKEKLEEYFGKSYSQIVDDQKRIFKNNAIAGNMRDNIVKDVTVSPSEIRKYFSSIPTDSLPYINTKVEVQVIVRKPEVRLAEIDRIKSRLREYSEEINSGKSSFSTLARLYSEDKRTAINGGEYGFVSRSTLEPEFARVVFNMSTGQKVSPIIETQEGYHIVQVIEKRGELINFRHILLRPRVTAEALEVEKSRLDSVAMKINSGTISFDEAVERYSTDDNTINNHGLMVNKDYNSSLVGSSEFLLDELPQDISRAIATLKTGELSQAFISYSDNGTQQVMLVKLYSRSEAHRANLQQDFQTIKELALAEKKQKTIDEWIRDKQKTTFVEIAPEYRNCNFHYPNWLTNK